MIAAQCQRVRNDYRSVFSAPIFIIAGKGGVKMQDNTQGSTHDRLLLTVKDVVTITGWSQTKVREILNRKDSGFTIRCGKNIYAHKELFLKHLEDCAKFGRKI